MKWLPSLRNLCPPLAALVLLAGCSGSTTSGPVDYSTDGAPGPRIDAAAAELARLRDGGFSGVVLVDVAGELLVEGVGMADREAAVRNDADTVFDIGSLTKQFTAAAILRLEMDGRLSVDDPLATFFDQLPPDTAEITLHQLLTHTSGLPDVVGEDEEPIKRNEFVDRIAGEPLRQEPGEQYHYSNVGYSMLAAVIEVVTGESYEAYLRQALFVPAGLTATGYVLPRFAGSTVAVGYDGDAATGRPNELGWDGDGPYWNLRGNGGILSTATDMHRWHRALLGDDILDAAAKAKLYGHHVREGDGADTFYGYGWVLTPVGDGTDLIAHNGGNGIFFADFLRFVDEDVAIFLATNASRGSEEDAAYDIARAIFAEGAQG